ncbi:unnamed protein product [Owenia fusiformis]|uniref:Uncharacterized protein n=1 Tax=Owenia fusiformis TaxID=6347 RepID=A0A8J1XI29_OWEFU|nr:unnamed protein product [Owenia fusiformis]
MNTQPQKTEPDPDAIKMFVGQIPRSMDENDLRQMFEEYGSIYQLNVLRDKLSGQSKGCCFVTFYERKSALEAQNALHNIKTLPGMQHPIQMKPADSEKKNEERKLFIGMLSKKCTENDVRMMFAPFGSIEECTVLREQNSQSRGCAFVTYSSRQCAQNAIKAMHHSQTMEGCRAPLVVKFADTQKEKDFKKVQQMNASIINTAGLAGLAGGGGVSPQYLALLQQAASGGNVNAFGNLANQPGIAAALGNLLGLSNTNSSNGGNGTAAPPTSNGSGDVASLQNLQNLQNLAALANITNTPGSAPYSPGGQSLVSVPSLPSQFAVAAASPTTAAAMPTSGSTSVSPSTGSMAGTNTTNSTFNGLAQLNGNSSLTGMNGIGGATTSQTGMEALYSGIQQYAAFTNQAAAAQFQQANATDTPAGKQTEGPEGANLFIYHLPQEFSDHDLMQTFLPFGNVISSKVFIDKQTNLSKCFGFASYDNPMSAQAAIQAMNGFQIGMKRLKVQLKRPKNDKPY